MIRKLIFVSLAAMLGGCSAVNQAPKVDYAQACDPSNTGKKVAVEGFLQVTQRIPCMKMLKPGRECAFKFADKVNIVGKEIILYLPEGSGKGAVETPESAKAPASSSVFGPGDIKIRLSDGTEITPQPDVATPVTASGEIRLTSGENPVCSIAAESVIKR